MSSLLLHPPGHVSPGAALHLSQQAPTIIEKSSDSSSSGFGLGLLSQLYQAESSDSWTIYENLMLSCLRTGDDESARLCLSTLTTRFGADNEHIMALKGIYQEAVAVNDAALEKTLAENDSELAEDPTNMPIAKRRIALLKSMARVPDAIAGLVQLLDASPSDAESWAELSDLYFAQGLYQQAIFSLEEVLLITPNAWNLHARMGELLYAASVTGNLGGQASSDEGLANAVRFFCRSIELCDGFLRGFYGLKLATGRLLNMKSDHPVSNQAKGGKASSPSVTQLQKLNQHATAKLAEIVRRGSSGETGWSGYSKAELIAARELLDRDVVGIER